MTNNTIVTQCLDTNDPNSTSHSGNNSNEIKKQKLDEYVDDFFCTKKKPKCKKYLDNFRNEIDDFVVHKSTKDFCITPSIYSVSSHNEPEDIKWSDFLPRLVPKTKSEVENEKMMRTTGHLESSTIVNDNSNKNGKNLYNLFVDLLETTFNVYNVKTEFDTPKLTGTHPSRNSLEINMPAPKSISSTKCRIKSKDSLHIQNKADTFQKKKSSYTHENFINDVKRTASPIIVSNRKRKLKSSSFVNKKKNPEMKTQSFNHQKPVSNKKMLRENRKQNLLNMLKEQLKVDNRKYIEPQTFFQALKLMAKSKKQKIIQFDEPVNKMKKDNDSQSKFNKHQLITSNARTNKKAAAIAPLKTVKSFRQSYHNPPISITRKLLPNISENNIESRHSLQVYAFDYESPKDRKIINSSPVPSAKKIRRVPSNEGTLYLSDESSDFETF